MLGIPHFDHLVGSVKGALITITGLPQHGKTALCSELLPKGLIIYSADLVRIAHKKRNNSCAVLTATLSGGEGVVESIYNLLPQFSQVILDPLENLVSRAEIHLPIQRHSMGMRDRFIGYSLKLLKDRLVQDKLSTNIVVTECTTQVGGKYIGDRPFSWEALLGLSDVVIRITRCLHGPKQGQRWVDVEVIKNTITRVGVKSTILIQDGIVSMGHSWLQAGLDDGSVQQHGNWYTQGSTPLGNGLAKAIETMAEMKGVNT
jgi:hypothetical protein